MNLCGGITHLEEQELFLSIPDDEFTLTPRKKTSSAPSRRKKSVPSEREVVSPLASSRRMTPESVGNAQSRSSSSNDADSSGTKTNSSNTVDNSSTSMLNPVSREDLKFLNPVSREDLKKYRSRQRRVPLRGMKSSSILMKKLESGFNLTWLNRDTKGRAVNLATNSDKSYLRIRLRDRDGDDNENDGSKSNLPHDIKLKVRHIARVGSDIDKHTSEHFRGNEQSADKSTSYFVIKLKTGASEWSKFKFVAESLAERDTVVLAIRSLMDQVTVSEATRRNSRGERKIDSANGGLNENSVQQQPKDECEDVFFDFDTENVKPCKRTDLAQTLIHEGRDDSEQRSAHGRKDDHYDSEGTDHRDGPTDEKITSSNLVGSHCSLTSTTPADMGTTNKSESKASTQLNVSKYELAEKQSTVSKLRQESSLVHVSSQPGADSKRRARSRKTGTVVSREVGADNTLAMDSAKASLIYDAIGCSTMGCQSQALAAVEDGDLASMAANQMTGPWCTDDICTASLKDFADSMRGIFEVREESTEGFYATSAKQSTMAEEYISGFLGDTSMTEFLSVKDLWSAAATQNAKITQPKTRNLQNRAKSVDGTAIRVKNLKNQMTFDGADTKTKSFVQIVHSFDDVNRTGKWERQKDSYGLKAAGQFDSSAYLDKGMNDVQEVDGNEILYYDSDPEGSTERTLKRGPRRAMTNRNASEEKNKTMPRQALDVIDSSRLGLGRKWKRLDENLVQDIIEATKNETLVMMFHPTPNGRNNNLPPICVKLWIESGVYLMDGTFLLPKLTWLPLHESTLDCRTLNITKDSPGSLDLLDVCRVIECSVIDRQLHPFAHSNRSFIIQTQSGRYLFEAQSKEERGRVVNGLKLVIARLASLLMLRDLRAVDEFFGGNSVPGEAPAWARKEKNETSLEYS